MSRKTKVALLINMISPARISLYSCLAEAFEFLILYGGTERNRDSWRGFDNALPAATVTRAWGWQIPFSRRQKGRAFDEQYLHVNPGYLWLLFKSNPDVVVTSEMGARTLFALIYGTFFRKPVWVWWGGTVYTESKKAGLLKRALRSILARWTQHWISYGKSSTEYLLTLGISRRQILEIQNTADERYFQTAAQPHFELRPRPVLLYVGQFIGRKGVDLFLRAAAALQHEGLKFSLLLVGNGRDKPAAERLANDLGLAATQFHPSQPPQLMLGVYRSADVLVFPTLEDPWGLVASEAMLAGLPVLCSQYAGCAPELFPSESIFDPLNPDEFREKLRVAIAGGLPTPDVSRLQTTSQVASALIAALENSANGTPAPLTESRHLTT
jgi:glycosyltransferase involved in cell wall biosynthesis